jgi:hypothetical protein
MQPLYIARELFDMRYGSRAGKTAEPMKASSPSSPTTTSSRFRLISARCRRPDRLANRRGTKTMSKRVLAVMALFTCAAAPLLQGAAPAAHSAKSSATLST